MRLIILGAGGYGHTICDLAQQSGKYCRIDFLDDEAKGDSILGKCEDFLAYSQESVEMYPAFGDDITRLQWISRLEENHVRIPRLIHPTAYVSPTAVVGTGTVILPKAVVNTECRLGKGCLINCAAVLDHGCILEDGAHICVAAVVMAQNHIGRCQKIAGSQVIQPRTYPITK